MVRGVCALLAAVDPLASEEGVRLIDFLNMYPFVEIAM